ncbi:hypothetical protein [Neisseria dumasiana]|nr:hypothetical protein [Neisseria dumasiana]
MSYGYSSYGFQPGYGGYYGYGWGGKGGSKGKGGKGKKGGWIDCYPDHY